MIIIWFSKCRFCCSVGFFSCDVLYHSRIFVFTHSEQEFGYLIVHIQQKRYGLQSEFQNFNANVNQMCKKDRRTDGRTDGYVKSKSRCKIEFWPHWISTRGVLIQRAAIKIQRIFHVELRPPETGGHCITTPPTDKILTPLLNCDPT